MAALVSMLARKHFLSNLHSPRTPKSGANARAASAASGGAGITDSENSKKSESENVIAARVKFSRKCIALKTRKFVNDVDQRS